jgi:3-dehydroquinate synthase
MYKKITIQIPVSPKRSYDILIGISLESAAADIAKKFTGSNCFIITDSNVYRLYGKQFAKYLRRCGMKADLIYFKAGEGSKNRETKEYLEDQMLKKGVRRNSIIVALGGGVVGDIAGFTAATINRGIPFIQIPTTLLSQVDSSVGGKVAVDHPLGKNLIGAFYQPARVYIDPLTLNTLSDYEYRNGLSEVVKYGAILDKNFFSYLERNWAKISRRDIQTLIYIIERCCALKTKVVEKDEREKSYRRVLNFGHTLGHAIELSSNYKIPHGSAVSIGMVLETELAQRIGILKRDSVHYIMALLMLFGLPTRLPVDLKKSVIISAAQRDKKAIGSKINYTLISNIGKGIINVALSKQDVLRALGD